MYFSTNFVCPYNPEGGLNPNIVLVDIQKILSKKPKQVFYHEDQVICQRCFAYTTYLTRTALGKWRCDMCRAINFNGVDSHEILYSDVEYITNYNNRREFKVDQRAVFFCIDLSLSMVFRNRLAKVKQACIDSLDKMYAESPDYKVSLFTFSSHGHFYGNGDFKVNTLTRKDWEDRTIDMDRMRQYANDLAPIRETRDMLRFRVSTLAPSLRSTEICGPLLQCVLMASTFEYSYVFLCTDGWANTKDTDIYDEIAEYAKQNCVKIYTFSYKEKLQNMKNMGKVAFDTGGLIYIPLIKDWTRHFFSVLDQNRHVIQQEGLKIGMLTDYDYIRVDEGLLMKSPNQMVFKDGRGIEWTNIKNDFVQMFPYKYCLIDDAHDPKNFKINFFQFQLQIKYGNRCRVITHSIYFYRSKPTPEILNPEVIHAYYLKLFSVLILKENDLELARYYARLYRYFLKEFNLSYLFGTNVIGKILSPDLDPKLFNDEDTQLFYNNMNLKTDLLSKILRKNDVVPAPVESRLTKRMWLPVNKNLYSLPTEPSGRQTRNVYAQDNLLRTSFPMPDKLIKQIEESKITNFEEIMIQRRRRYITSYFDPVPNEPEKRLALEERFLVVVDVPVLPPKLEYYYDRMVLSNMLRTKEGPKINEMIHGIGSKRGNQEDEDYQPVSAEGTPYAHLFAKREEPEEADEPEEAGTSSGNFFTSLAGSNLKQFSLGDENSKQTAAKNAIHDAIRKSMAPESSKKGRKLLPKRSPSLADSTKDSKLRSSPTRLYFN